MALHADLTSIHPGAYVDSADPGAVGAKKLWIDTTDANAPILKKRNAGDTDWDKVAPTHYETILVELENSGSAITTGVKKDITLDYACTITQVTLLADQSGSIVLDLWVDTYANYPPTVADTITASAKPTISAATKSQDSTLTGWTTTFAAGSTMRVNVDSVATVTRVLMALKVRRT
jgi:hypothetical protein